MKTAWGTGLTLFRSEAGHPAGRSGSSRNLIRWYSPAEVLKMATADNAEVLALSGPRNPYPGKLGVRRAGRAGGSFAVGSTAVSPPHIKLIEDPDRNFKVIMKGRGRSTRTRLDSRLPVGAERQSAAARVTLSCASGKQGRLACAGVAAPAMRLTSGRATNVMGGNKNKKRTAQKNKPREDSIPGARKSCTPARWAVRRIGGVGDGGFRRCPGEKRSRSA